MFMQWPFSSTSRSLIVLLGINHGVLPACRMLSRCQAAPAGWAHHDERARMLVHEFLRVGDRAGSDVKLDLGIPFGAKAWPRSGIRAHLFNWRGGSWVWLEISSPHKCVGNASSCTWDAMEVEKASRFQHRILHLVDNQVVASVIAQGRSSSFRRRKSINKLTSPWVARGLQLLVGYVATHDNPSDLPSRWAAKPNRKLKLADRSAKRNVKGSA